ncbi:MAG: hypothetical protein HUK19_05255 [Fibrobacter sp.]|nr:hypothetical protein [Fibrobacter sp.]
MLKLNRLLFVLCAVLLLSVSAYSDNRSIWQKVVDFFSPAPAVMCDGPVCEEVRNLDSRIGKVEGRYSRERRPVHKDRLKKELDSLHVVRDSLWAIVGADIESTKKGFANVEKVQVATGQQKVVQKEVDKPGVAKVDVAKAEVGKPESAQPEACVHDTVYVRDTVVVHDTLYVVLTNKPSEAPAEPAPATSPAAPSAQAPASIPVTTPSADSSTAK